MTEETIAMLIVLATNVETQHKIEGKIMRILMWFAIIMALIGPASAATETASITIYPGENWIAAPLIPINPNPTAVFAGCDIDGHLIRFNATAEVPVTYATANPALFGNIQRSDGYKLTSAAAGAITVSYEGKPDGSLDGDDKMHNLLIALPGNRNDGLNAGGMAWVGNPYNHKIACDDFYIWNGNQSLTLAQAVQQHWIDGLWTSLDGATQTTFTAGLSTLSPTEGFLRVGQMYEMRTYRDNLTLIIEAHPGVPEPSTLAALLCGIACAGGFIRRRTPTL